MKPPAISVIVPCYNVARFIPQTLDSILDQSGPEAEILVVDDGSTDAIGEALKPFQNRIRYIRIPNSGGPSRPRNIGLQEAAGDLVAFCDADDLMLPGKLRVAGEVFEGHPEVDFLFTNFQTCDETGRKIEGDFLAEYREFRRFLKPVAGSKLSLLEGADAYRALLRANFIGTSSVVGRTRVFPGAGGFDETMPNAEDIDLWRRIALRGHTFAFLDEVYHSYRLRSGSISHGESRRYPALIKGAEKEIPHCTDPEDLRFIKDEIVRLWLGYGYALRKEGQKSQAQKAYRTALGMRKSWEGIKGLVLSSLVRNT
jgi:teichuronic acid biosynthesis glycosyltransferase TuaG